jgi:hypothetical protein
MEGSLGQLIVNSTIQGCFLFFDEDDMVLFQEVAVTRALHDDSISLAGCGSELKATTSTSSNQQHKQK